LKRLPPPLLALSPGDLDELRAFGDFLARVDAALAAGLRGILLRELELDDAVHLRLASELRARLDRLEAGAGWLGVHDRVHVALAAGADAIHLGFRSLASERVASITADKLAIGLSTHAFDDPCDWSGADYIFHGPVRATPSKNELVVAIGTEGLERAVLQTDCPIWALGGVRPEDVRGVMASGARGVAALSGILGCTDPGGATRAYLGEGLEG